MQAMKAKILQKLKTKCVFKTVFYIGFIFSLKYSFEAHSIEFQSYEKKIKTNYHVRSAVERFSRKTIEDTLRSFVAAGRPSRAYGSPGHTKIQTYLEEKLLSFNSAGTSFRKIEFDPELSKIKNLKGVEKQKAKNFIWEKKGIVKPETVLILTAHYDTILRDAKTKELSLKGEMPGADNNGSGVATLLNLIELLDKLDIPKTVQVVFLDAEELGAQGSIEYIKTLSAEGQKIQGLLNIMMIAHDSRNTDREQKLNNMSLYFIKPEDQELARVFEEAGKRNVSSIKFSSLLMKEGSGLPGDLTLMNLSKTGLPAIMMTQGLESDLNPRYLSSNDFVETLNIPTYISTFKFLANSVLTWNYDVVK
jgi:hypothetical protein